MTVRVSEMLLWPDPWTVEPRAARFVACGPDGDVHNYKWYM